MSPTDDQIRELVRRFATLEVSGWDDAAFDRALAHLGWRPAQYSADEQRWMRDFSDLYRDKYDTGLGNSHRGTISQRDVDRDRPYISVRVGTGDELFRRVRALLEEDLGSPVIMRGPGPLLRWRGPHRLLELEKFLDGAYLRVHPTEAVENDEYRISKWAEAEDGLGQLGYWQVVGRGSGTRGMSFPGGYFAEDWTEFEERLAPTLQSVVQDFALLDVPGHFTGVVHTPEDRRFVQWTTLKDWSLQIEASIPGDAGPGWSDAMAALGWQPSDSPDIQGLVIRRFPNVGAEEAKAAARMLAGALRSYGVAFTDLWYELISPDMFLILLGIGLPTRHGQRF